MKSGSSIAAIKSVRGRRVNAALPGVGALALSVLCAAMAGAQAPAAESTKLASSSAETRQPTKEQIAAIKAMPLTFEKNMGQADKRASYLSRMTDYTLFLTGSDSVLAHKDKEKDTASALKLHWLGASSTVTPQGDGALRGKSNYLIGNDRSQWHSNIPNYQRVREDALYPGVDLIYYGNHEQLEYDLTVAPGADPGAIKLAIDGAKSLSIDKASGDLVIVDQIGSELRFRKPVVYQQEGERKNPVPGSYLLSANNTVTFALGAYDHSKPLVIDPTVVYSTVISGTASADEDFLLGMAVDGNGFVYILAETYDLDLTVTAGAYQNQNNSPYDDYYVAKFDPTQSGANSLVYATYIGSSSSITINGYNPTQLINQALAVDSLGDAYFTGLTGCYYPTTANAFTTFAQSFPTTYLHGCASYSTAVLTKLDPTGSTLLYSTDFFADLNGVLTSPVFSGTAKAPYARLVTVGANQVAYIAGQALTGLEGTGSAPYDVQYNFVAAFDTTKSGSASLLYAEYVPMNMIYTMTADAEGNLYLGGNYSGPLPTAPQLPGPLITLNGFQTTAPSGAAAEVVRLNSAGAATYATVIGEAASSTTFTSYKAPAGIYGISVDANQIVYAGGIVQGPVTQLDGLDYTASYQGHGPFVAKIDTNQTGASSLLYSSFVSYDPNGMIFDVGNDAAGHLAFVGETTEYYTNDTYTLVDQLTQPVDVPMQMWLYADQDSGLGTSYAGIIDTSKTDNNALTFFSFLDGVLFPYFVAITDNPTSGQAEYLYVGGGFADIVGLYPFPAVPGSFNPDTHVPTETQPPFFYKISLSDLTVAPNPLNFGNQCINTTSAAQTVTATNIGEAAITMDSVTASAPFSETDNCLSSPLAGVATGQTTGGSCTMNVSFAPTNVGPFTGTLTLTDSDFSSPQTVTLTGTGIQPLVTLTPSSLSFTATDGTISAPQTITLTNTGTAAVNISTIQIKGANAADFSETDNCPATLNPSPAAGSSCTISITFDPPALAPGSTQRETSISATLVVTDTDQCAPQKAPLTGTGTAPPPIGLSIKETIHVTDNLPSSHLAITEQIHVSDAPALPVKATPLIYWFPTASINYGTILKGLLDATAWGGGGSTPLTGVFAYTAKPTGGSAFSVIDATMLNPGSYTLTVTFTPDSALYSTATGTAPLTVTSAAATLTSPVPGSTLPGPGATFQWTAGTGVTAYRLCISDLSAGNANLYDSGVTTALSANVTNLPLNGGNIYVRLLSIIGGVWQHADYSFIATAPAALTSPAQGAMLVTTGQTFTWAPVPGATGYILYLGSTGVGSGNLLDDHTTSTSVTAGELPINGEPLYLRLWTNFNGTWRYNDYSFTADEPAALTAPAAGAVLAATGQTFTWAPVPGATDYILYLGSTGVGSGNLLDDHTTSTSVTAGELPINGEPLYLRLWTNFNGTWRYNDYSFTADEPAALTAPAAGAVLAATGQTFTWAAVPGATGYTLFLGSTGVGSGDLLDDHTTSTSVTTGNLPINGEPLYVRLWTNFNGTWRYNDYLFTAAAPAALTSPLPGSTLAASGQILTWAPVGGATGYILYLGTSAGAGNLLDAHTTSTSVTTGNLPINGETIYARLWTNFNGVWKHNDYTFTAK